MSSIEEAFAALRADLLLEAGPRISTMRNYPFAIVPYPPKREFELRKQAQRLIEALKPRGWFVRSISLHKLLLKRIEAQGETWAARVAQRERALPRDRALHYLAERLTPLLEGPEGIAADCGRLIRDHAKQHPEAANRTLVLIGRAGALYPFSRSSALLKHLDGRTHNVPAVLLYPGERRGPTALSFMGVLDPDKDYRPRIYP